MIKCIFIVKTLIKLNKQESTDIKHFIDSKAFIEYSNDMDDIYKNVGEYNPHKICKTLIVFDDMIANMLNNKKNLSSSS